MANSEINKRLVCLVIFVFMIFSFALFISGQFLMASIYAALSECKLNGEIVFLNVMRCRFIRYSRQRITRSPLATFLP